jgi:hypothetical protein
MQLLAVAAIAVVVTVGGCGLGKPESPTWDTRLVLPLISHQYDMLELVDRIAEDALTYDSAGLISFNVEQQFDTVAVNAGLEISNLSTSFSEQLGEITIVEPTPVSSAILLSDHLALGLGGDISEASFTETKALPAIADFESATISSGALIVSATNEFGIDLDSVAIAITDNVSAQQVGLAVFQDGLDIGETESKSINLSGKEISNTFSYTAYFHTDGGTLFTLADKEVGVEAAFADDLIVSSAVARVPAQNKSYTETVNFDENNHIDFARIKEGSLSVEITNSTNLTASVQIAVNQLVSGGEPLVKTASIAPRQTTHLSEDLAGYEFTPLPGEIQPSLVVTTEAAIAGSGSSAVQIASTDSFAVILDVYGITLSSVEGIIEPSEISIEPITEDVEIPDGFENFSLKEAVMTVEIYSAVDMPAEISLRIEGSDGQRLDIDDTICRGNVENPGLTQITITDLTEFLNPIPSQITISGTATVGDGLTAGEVTENDFVCGEVQISSPLVMSIGATDFEADITEADLGDLEDEDVDRLRHGVVEAHLTNHLPLEASLELYLGSDTATLYTSPQLTMGPFSVASGVIGGTGLVSDTVGSDFTQVLTLDDLQVLKNNPLYVGQVITFPGTDGQTVRIVSSDYIDIQAYMVVDVRVGESK